MGWLSGYQYRKKIPVNSVSGGATDYQVKFTVYSGAGSDSAGNIYLNSHALSWPNDLRITTSDGTTLVPFWRESSDASQAVIWTKLPTIPSSSTTDYYIYYGKSSDTDASSGTDTFDFYDDFNRANGASGWSDYTGTSEIASNELKCTADGSGYGMHYKACAVTKNILVSGKAKGTRAAPNSGRPQIYIQATNNQLDSGGALGLRLGIWDSNVRIYDNGVSKGSAAFSFSNDVFYRFEYIIYNDYSFDVYVWQDGGSKPGTPTLTIAAFTPVASGSNIRIAENSDSGAVNYYDDIKIRKYVSPEPTWATPGGEESSAHPKSWGFIIGLVFGRFLP